MKTLAALTVIAAGFAAPALAGEAQMTTPIQAGILNEGPLHMVAYWVEAEGDAYEVTATFAAREGAYRPMRFVVELEDGAALRFKLPDYPSAFYRFERSGSVVTASVEVISM